MDSLYFEPCDLPPEAEALLEEIRDFLADNLYPYSPEVRSRAWAGEIQSSARNWAGPVLSACGSQKNMVGTSAAQWSAMW